jgi:autotransporter-associated beta strand protein
VGGPLLAANALWYDPAGNGGAGEAIIGYIGAGNVVNDIYSVPAGGGPATLIVSYNNSMFGGSGIPSGISVDGSGNLTVSHNNVITGTTRIDRATLAVTTIAPSAFVTGENALNYDAVADDIILVGNATGASATNVSRQIRLIDIATGVGSVLVTIGSLTNPPPAGTPGGNTNGIDIRNGVRIYGRACNSAGGALMSIGTTSSANLGNGAFGIRVTGGGAMGSGILAAGLSPTYTDLSGLGYPGCAAYNSLDLIILPIAFDGFGNYVLPAPLPMGPFAGISIYVQAADGTFAPVLGLTAGMKVTFF